MSCKITFIGAGSVVFAKRLIGDILQFPELSDATICLMDVDPARLEVADVMARRMVEVLGVKARIVSTLDRRKAIRGAKYVICTIQVGGYKPATVTDFAIPARYGLRQTIGDTLGIGGIFRGLRTIPVLNEIARDIENVGHPDCLFINYSNPMAMNCWAVDREVGIPVVGLCHSVFGTARALAKYAGVPYESVSYLVAGVNHMAFFLRFVYKGQDAYPLLFQALDGPHYGSDRVRFEMMRRLGYFVTESSDHQAEYVPHFIPHGPEVMEKFNITLDEYIRRIEAGLATWAKQEHDLLGGSSGRIHVEQQSEEYGSYIIHSIETGTPRTVYANVPNRDVIDNLRRGSCVEVPCLVDATGLRPVRIGTLPSQLAAICATQIHVQELTVDAALSGRRECIYHAAMADPNTAATLPLDQIWAMCDEMIQEHQKNGLLGPFLPTIPGTGRTFTGTGDRLIARLLPVGEFRTAAGERNTFTLRIENPSVSARKLVLNIKTDHDGWKVVGPATLRTEVPAGKMVKLPVETLNRSALPEGATLRLLSTNPDILTIDAECRPRTVYKPGEDGRTRFRLDLDGFEAVTGSLKLTDDALHLTAEVADSNILPDPDLWYAGSYLELLVASAADAPATKIRFVPRKGKTGLLVQKRCDTKPATLEGLKPTLRVSATGYLLEVSLPLECLELPQGSKSLLFNFAANLGALGEAHSGGRTYLHGNSETAGDTAVFGFLTEAPAPDCPDATSFKAGR